MVEIAAFVWLILAGVIIFVAGQIVVRILVEPVHRLKRVIADIAFCLIRYSHIYKQAGRGEADDSFKERFRPEELGRVEEEYVRLASSLNAGLHLVPWYWMTRLLFALPSEKNVLYARDELLKLSKEIRDVPIGFDYMDRQQIILSFLKAV
jgi:hypothetical protein